MTAEAIKLGPFIGGINSEADLSTVANAELTDCVNFDLDIDGSLISRPPILETAGNGAWTERIVITGRAIFAGVSYLIGSNVNGTYYFNGVSWNLIVANLQSRKALQYFDRVWIIATHASPVGGGSWSPTAGWTADANMPRGESGVFHKARLFVVAGLNATSNNSRLSFTDPIISTALTWNPINIVDVSPGDGEPLVDIIVYNDNLMLFKQDSTYILAYDIMPKDAILREINSKIGASTRHCVVFYENTVFLYHEGNIYEIINYNFERVNEKVPFLYDSSAPSARVEDVFICLMGERLIVRYYNRLYVYNLKTRVWTRWESSNPILHNFGPLVEFPSNPTQSVLKKYYAGSSIGAYKNVVVIQDGHDAVAAEEIESSIKTKIYDLDDSMSFKKLMWWGADVLTTRNIESSTVSLSRTSEVSVDSTAVAVPGVLRQFVKFKKAIRFRQVYFMLSLFGNGTTTQGPPRLFSLSAIVGSKQTVGKEVN